MSWGYFLDLNLTLPTSEWKRLGKTKTGDHHIAPEWWGLAEAGLAERFTAPDFDRTTLAQAIATFRREEAIGKVEVAGANTKIRVCALLDRGGDPGIAKSIAALVDAAKAKAKGTLRLVNDGSYAGEDGVEITVARGKLSRKAITDCVEYSQKLGTEILGGERAEDDAEAPPKPVAKAEALPKRLQKATSWNWADLDGLFKKRPKDAIAFFTKLAEPAKLVGSAKAYDAFHMFLFYLREHPKIDVEELVPLLRQFCKFPAYNPDKMRRYEQVRLDSMRLLARRKDPAARAVIDRFVKDFPERLEDTYSVGLIEIMGLAAIDLRARELEPKLRALLDATIPAYSPRQRKAELASAVAVLDRLKKAK